MRFIVMDHKFLSPCLLLRNLLLPALHDLVMIGQLNLHINLLFRVLLSPLPNLFLNFPLAILLTSSALLLTTSALNLLFTSTLLRFPLLLLHLLAALLSLFFRLTGALLVFLEFYEKTACEFSDTICAEILSPLLILEELYEISQSEVLHVRLTDVLKYEIDSFIPELVNFRKVLANFRLFRRQSGVVINEGGSIARGSVIELIEHLLQIRP
jgi:hypothetical protein